MPACCLTSVAYCMFEMLWPTVPKLPIRTLLTVFLLLPFVRTPYLNTNPLFLCLSSFPAYRPFVAHFRLRLSSLPWLQERRGNTTPHFLSTAVVPKPHMPNHQNKSEGGRRQGGYVRHCCEERRPPLPPRLPPPLPPWLILTTSSLL